MATKQAQTVPKAKPKQAPAAKRAPKPSDAVPRSLAGVVGKSGEIVDQDGRVIGKIPDRTKLSQIAGHDVTATGDILDDSGEEVLGKASLNKGEYTTQPAKDVKQKAGTAKEGAAKAKPAVPSKAKPAAAAAGTAKKPQQPAAAAGAAKKPQPPAAAAGTAKKPQQAVAKGVGIAQGQVKKAKSQQPQQAQPQMPPTPSETEEASETLQGEEEPPEAAEGVGEEALQGEPEEEEGEQEEEEEEEGEEQGEEEEEEEEAEEEEEEAEEEEPAEEMEGEEFEGVGVAEGEDIEGEDIEAGEELDFSLLEGATVNKSGNLVNENGDVIGHLVEGDPKKLAGKQSDANGQIWDNSGNVLGVAEPLSAEELEAFKDFAPFENFPDAKVEGDGRVMSEGVQVGIVVEGDPKRLKGSNVDEDGDILDRRGNVVGRAEPYDEPEPEPEEEIDTSILAGKKINKAGNAVDEAGSVFGRVIQGNVRAMVGRNCDKDGNVISETGEVMGKVELIPEEEREKLKVGPFEDLTDSTVTKDGLVVTPAGEVVGRLIEGDPKALFGRPVDSEGEIIDKSGNVLGRAERYEQPEEEKSPLAGRKVNQEGNIVDEDGNIIAKLTSGDVQVCSGKEVDNDGDVINKKGDVVGHVTLLEELPQETEEEKKAREAAEQDRELAGKIAACIEDGMERLRPICSMIVGKINAADAQDPDDLDEDQLVREVKPLIEEGGKILTELNGSIRGMDPDGRIQKQAKAKSGTQEASPEEHHLAEVVKELHTTVTQTIDEAKAKLDSMPHAKEELDPLFGLLSDPLGQIIAAVGLLLSGVLGLVGKLLGGLGLDKLLGGVVGGVGKTGKKAGKAAGGVVGGIGNIGGGAIGGILGGGKK